MRVAVAATERADLSQRMHVALDSVRVLAAPPEFVRTGPTKAGNYLYWESSCVFVTPAAEGTREIPGDLEFQAISESIAEWNNGSAGCSYMNIMEDTPKEHEVGRDDVNLIKFRDTSWCRPATGDDPPRCHSGSAAGLTTVVFVDDPKSARDGAIVDADVELNGVDFKIGLNGTSLGTAACLADLKNTLTHELGHLLGLEHPCRTSADPPRTDSQGAPVPTCTAAMTNPNITDATMYNFQDCGETKKATLSQDDINAICEIYPSAQDPGVCERVGETAGCCSAAPGSGLPLGTLLGAAGIGALVLRRRRRR
jgi:MYXO-CTERM domain-containing protein